MRPHDLSGRRFGRLIAIQRLPTRIKPSGQKYSVWACRCDCGKETVVRMIDLKTGNTKSCGCLNLEKISELNKTHGKSKKSRAYSIWLGIRRRCFDKKNNAYMNYGGRGITVCQRWLSFENFLLDMGEPGDGMQIERKDNDGPYSPGNCTWATAAQQARNRRSNIAITINGETLCLTDWCEKLNINYHRARARIIVLGWTPPQALNLESRS